MAKKTHATSRSFAIMSHEDWVPTLMAAVGESGIKAKRLKGHQATGAAAAAEDLQPAA